MNLPKIVGDILVFSILIGWIGYWAAMAWLNYSLGDILGAAITAVLFVIGGGALLVARLRSFEVSTWTA